MITPLTVDTEQEREATGNPKMLDLIVDRVHERHDNWEIKVVPTLPIPIELNEVTIIGGFSYALMSSRVRLLKAGTLLSVNGTKDTPPALARDFLNVKFKRGPRIRTPQRIDIQEDMPDLPLYAEPQRFDHGFYVDIKSAYWSIMEIVGWQIDYWPGHWLARGLGVRDFPWRRGTHYQKIARHSLVTAGGLGKGQMWIPKRRLLTEKSFGNHLANQQIIRLIRDVLNDIALEAREAGAIYTHTDGYICPNVQVLGKVETLISDWGLTARIKGEGAGAVHGVGSYVVGKLKTRRRLNRQVAADFELDNLQEDDNHAWLRKHFSKLAALKERDD